MRNYFTLAGVSSKSFGLYLNGRATFSSPERQMDFITVPGRDGDLTGLTTRLANGTLTYPEAFIYANFDYNMAALRAFLLSTQAYRKLTDTYHPGEYRMVTFAGPLELEVVRTNNAGIFDLSFIAQPQRWLDSGDETTTFTATGTITNPTSFPSKPLLRITTTRAAASVAGIGSTNITITHQGVIYIDCASGRAYNGATPLDSYVALNTIDYPVLQPGSNGVSLGTGISRIEITPRWWTV